MTHNLHADTITFKGDDGDELEGYLAVPTDVEHHGSIVVIHHLPGYDEATKEITRRFAANGYAALMPNLYSREAPGASSDDAAATVRAQGGVPDDRLVGDVAGAMAYVTSLPTSNAKVASIGFCSGGRQSFLAGCRLPLDGVVVCYGGFITIDTAPDFPLNFKAVISEVDGLSAPLLGLFGADDQNPSPEQVEAFAAALTKADKEFTFRTFDGAGHAFFATDRPSYRPEAATEGWRDVGTFLARTVG
ncbi:MAG: dienelactone hydrolase family protein [Acidimicrobiales bacterium]